MVYYEENMVPWLIKNENGSLQLTPFSLDIWMQVPWHTKVYFFSINSGDENILVVPGLRNIQLSSTRANM